MIIASRLSYNMVGPRLDPSLRLVTECNMFSNFILFRSCSSPFYPQTRVSRSQKSLFICSVISHDFQHPISCCYGRFWESCLLENCLRCLTGLYEYNFPDFPQITGSHAHPNSIVGSLFARRWIFQIAIFL